jgi:hypothetical protein
MPAMAEILHLTALLPAVVSACCTVGAARSRGAWGGISAVVMLAAMLDLAGGGVLPPLVWSALLIGSAVSGAAAARLARAAGRNPMVAHAALGLVVMAGLVVLMTAPGNAGGSFSAPGGHALHGSAAGPLAATVWGGTAAYLAFSGALVLRTVAARAHPVAAGGGEAGLDSARTGTWSRDGLEIAGMGSSVALMAAALLA